MVLTRDKIYQAFYDDSTVRGFLHSHSYTGNPLACSAALATLAIFETDSVLEKNAEKAAYLNHQLQALKNFPIEYLRTPSLQNNGMIWAFDVKTQNPKFSRDCYAAALKQGLLIRPIGNTVYLMPPYTVTEAEMDFMVNATVNTLKTVL